MKPASFFLTVKLSVAALIALGCWSTHAGSASAQPGSRAVPRQDYFLAFTPYNQGDFQGALRAFDSAAGGGVRSSEGRWIDSICYHTMMGECHYQMGNLAGAIERPGAARAVGGALAKNPIAIIVPCHRIVSASGGLGGFMGGDRRGPSIKTRLLTVEGSIASIVSNATARNSTG